MGLKKYEFINVEGIGKLDTPYGVFKTDATTAMTDEIAEKLVEQKCPYLKLKKETDSKTASEKSNKK